MDYARDLHSGKVVAAEDASPVRSYACPRPGCGGRVYFPEVRILRPHFRHYPGSATPECDEYSPGASLGGEGEGPPLVAVEEEPSELGLVLGQFDGGWGLGLRLPEIPSDELGEAALNSLRSAFIDVFVGSDRIVRVSALDLRPGVGAACVNVAPSLQGFRAQTAGVWPASIDMERWQLQSRGLEAKGTLFRLRRGGWTRLLARSGVYHGEMLLVLADMQCAPPASVVRDVHDPFSSRGLQWTVWEVCIPDEVDSSVAVWLARLGHDLVPRPWSVALATPARGYSERGDPVFWICDSPVLALEAPLPNAEALVTFTTASNAYSASVRASEGRVAHVRAAAQAVGITRLGIAAERNASLDITFIERPPHATLLELLAQTPRLRVWIGEQCLETWISSKHCVRLTSHTIPKVRVDLGADSERARVTVWERGKRRTQRGLADREIASVVESALSTASLIEIDADNFGRIEFTPLLSKSQAIRDSSVNDRLAWRDHFQSMNVRPDELTTPILLGHPRASLSLVARPVSAAALVRARLALRRRREAGGTL